MKRLLVGFLSVQFVRLLLAAGAVGQINFGGAVSYASGPSPIISGEVWIASCPSNQLGGGAIIGLGSVTSPYSGDFSAIMSSLQPNTTVHIGPGTFYTKAIGEGFLNLSERILGAGMDITIIKRADGFSYNTNAPVLISYSYDTTIQDLTLDCAGTNGSTQQHPGLSIIADKATVKNVKVINSCGNFGLGKECFPIFIVGTSNSATSGALISGCEVSSTAGDYITAISLDSAGVIENNRVIFPFLSNNAHPPFYAAYQTSGSAGVILRDNVAYGGTAGYYSDTYGETDLTAQHNRFYGPWQGFTVSKVASGILMNGLNIHDNYIEVTTNSYGSVGGAAIYISVPNGYMNNVNISDNLLRYTEGSTNSATNAVWGVYIAAQSNYNAKVIGNSWDATFVNQWATNQTTVLGNTVTQPHP